MARAFVGTTTGSVHPATIQSLCRAARELGASLGARVGVDDAPGEAPVVLEPRCVGTFAAGGASTRSATNTRGVRRVRALGRLYTLTCISSASCASRRVSRTTRRDAGEVGTSDDDARPADAGLTASPPTGLRAASRSAERHIAPKTRASHRRPGTRVPSRRRPPRALEH